MNERIARQLLDLGEKLYAGCTSHSITKSDSCLALSHVTGFCDKIENLDDIRYDVFTVVNGYQIRGGNSMDARLDNASFTVSHWNGSERSFMTYDEACSLAKELVTVRITEEPTVGEEKSVVVTIKKENIARFVRDHMNEDQEHSHSFFYL